MLGFISGTFARQIVVGLAQLGLIVMLSRKYGPEGVGIYTLAILIPLMGSQILTFGLQSASVYMGAKGTFTASSILYGNLLAAATMSLFFLFVSIPAATIWRDWVFGDFHIEFLALGIAAFPASFILTTLPTLAQAKHEFNAYNFFLLSQPSMQLLITAVILICDGTIKMVVEGFVFTSWLAAISMIAWMLNRWGREPAQPFSFIYNSIGYGIVSHLGNIATLLNYRAVIWVLTAIAGVPSSGLFILAMQPAEKLWLPSQAVATVSFPTLSKLHGKSQSQATDAVKIAEQLTRATLAITLILVLAAAALAKPAFPFLFGSQATPAATLFIYLLPGIVFWAPSRILATYIGASGAVRYNLWNSLATLGLNLSLIIPMVQTYGVEGAAVATSLAFTGDLIIRSIFYAKLVGALPFSWIVPTADDLQKLQRILTLDKT